MPDVNAQKNIASVQHPAIWVAAACCCGIATDRYFDLSFTCYAIIAIIAIVGFCIPHRRVPSQAKQLIAALIFISSLGACWHHAYWNFYPTNEISRWARDDSSPVCISATLLTEPRRVAVDPSNDHLNRPRGSTSQNRILIRCSSIRDGEQWSAAAGQLQLTAPDIGLGLHAGDQVQVWGRLRTISGPTNPGAFDFRHYYRSQRILCSLYCSHAGAIEVTKRSLTGAWLSQNHRDAKRF